MTERPDYVLKRADVPALPAEDGAPASLARMQRGLEKLSASAYFPRWQRRAWGLCGYYLVYADASVQHVTAAPLGAIDLRGVEDVQHDGRVLALRFAGGGAAYTLRAATAHEAGACADALRARIQWASLQTPLVEASPQPQHVPRLRRRSSTSTSASIMTGALDGFAQSQAQPPPAMGAPSKLKPRNSEEAPPPPPAAASKPAWLKGYPRRDRGTWEAHTAAWLDECGLGIDDAAPRVQARALARALPPASEALAERCSATGRRDVVEHLCEAWAARVVFCAGAALQNAGAAGAAPPSQLLRVAAALWEASAAEVECEAREWRGRLQAAAEDAEGLYLESVTTRLRSSAEQIVRMLSDGGAPSAGASKSDPHSAKELFAAPRRATATSPPPSGTALARDFFVIATQFIAAAPTLRTQCRVIACREAARLAGEAMAAAVKAADGGSGEALSVGRLVRTTQLLTELHAAAGHAVEHEAAHEHDVRRAQSEMLRARGIVLDLGARLVGDDAIGAWRDCVQGASGPFAGRAVQGVAAALRRADELLGDMFVLPTSSQSPPPAPSPPSHRVCGRVLQRLVLHVVLEVLAPVAAPMPPNDVVVCTARLREWGAAWLGARDAAVATEALGDLLDLMLCSSQADAETRALALIKRRCSGSKERGEGRPVASAAAEQALAAAGVLVRRRWGRGVARAMAERMRRGLTEALVTFDSSHCDSDASAKDADASSAASCARAESDDVEGGDADDEGGVLDHGDAHSDHDYGMSGILHGWRASHVSHIVYYKALVRAGVLKQTA